MSENFEVATPILNGPFHPPKEHWKIEPDRPAVRVPGRRKAGYFYRPPNAPTGEEGTTGAGEWWELDLVNLIRERMAKWQADGRPGLTRASAELIDYWRREGREQRLFFAQLEAAETIIFLNEARVDYLQGVSVPLDETSDERKIEGFDAFRRSLLQDGDRIGQIDRHGNAGGVEHREQDRQSKRRALFRYGTCRLPQCNNQKSTAGNRSSEWRGKPLPNPRSDSGAANARPTAGAGDHLELARV